MIASRRLRGFFETRARQYMTITAVAAIDKRIHAWHRSCEESRRLEEIPGIGPVVATALVAEIGDWQQFQSGRSLAAWIGLVPKHSTGGKERLRSITKRVIAACDGYKSCAKFRRTNETKHQRPLNSFSIVMSLDPNDTATRHRKC